MGAAVEVLGGPHLAIRTFDRQRVIGQPTGQRVLAGFFQCSEVNRGLDQRANRPHGIQCAVETGETGLAAADHGLHLAGFRVGHDHGGFDFIRTFTAGQALEGVVDRRFGLHLQDGVEAGEDPKALFGQVFVAVVFAQLALDQVDKAGE